MTGSMKRRRLLAQRYTAGSGGAEGLARRFGRSVQAIYALIKRLKVLLRDCVERRLGKEERP